MRVLYLLGGVVAMVASAAHAVEFEDYDFSRFSQEVTECDRLASHGRDPGHVAPAVSSSGMDKPAAIAACRDELAIYKVPIRVVTIDEFPTTASANGTKIQKNKLRDLAVALLD